jgi:hypothetical protein
MGTAWERHGMLTTHFQLIGGKIKRVTMMYLMGLSFRVEVK